MITPTVVLRVPPRFYEDHLARDCGPTGEVLREGSGFYEVKLDSMAYDDLLTDCEYYMEMAGMGEGDSYFRGLATSAKATLKRLRAVERPEGPPPNY